MTPSPRALILRLLLGAEAQGDGAMGVRELLACGTLFGLTHNRVRVALARAVKSGLLDAPQRGHYTLGPAAQPLADEARRWRTLPALLTDWDGAWLAVHVDATRRSERSAQRARERAFAVLGLAELERGLYLRPDNLVGGVDALRQRLQALMPGPSGAGTVMMLRGLNAADDHRARILWDARALNQGYRDSTVRLSAWLDGVRSQTLERAAREVFELGDQAIRQLVFDPWLPAPLVDAAARRRFVAAVLRHDDIGQSIRREFLKALHAQTSLQRAPTLPRKPALEALR